MPLLPSLLSPFLDAFPQLLPPQLVAYDELFKACTGDRFNERPGFTRLPRLSQISARAALNAGAAGG